MLQCTAPSYWHTSLHSLTSHITIAIITITTIIAKCNEQSAQGAFQVLLLRCSDAPLLEPFGLRSIADGAPVLHMPQPPKCWHIERPRDNTKQLGTPKTMRASVTIIVATFCGTQSAERELRVAWDREWLPECRILLVQHMSKLKNRIAQQ